MLIIDQLIKRQGNALLLPAINLRLSGGQCAVIQCNNELGHLFIQLLLGAVPASGGQVQFDGDDLHSSFKQKASQVGISLLNEGLYERLKVKDYLSFYKDLYGAATSSHDILVKIGLLDKQNSSISKLTFSEKKRLQLGRSIIHNPSFIIWEEPEQNVDIESHIIIRALIAALLAEGKAILITTSYLADAVSIASEVYRLDANEFKKLDIIDEPETGHTEEDKAEEEEIETTALNEPAEQEENSSFQSELEEVQPEAGIPSASSIPFEARPVRVEKIPAKVEDKIILFDPTEIHFIESSEGISMLHVKGETFPCTFTLNDLEQKLKPFGFFRCHRSYIVNLQKVREVITWTRNSFSLILDDEKKSSIPLSKGKFDELKAILGI